MNFPVIKFLNLRKALNPSTTEKMSQAYYSALDRWVERFEANEPKAVTSFAGPVTLEMNRKLGVDISNKTNLVDIINQDASFGNYFKDVDGNTVLDMHMNNGSLAFGYASRPLVWLSENRAFERNIVNYTDNNVLPDHEYASKVHESVCKFAPRGLHEVHLSDTESSANETAIKVALRRQHLKVTGKHATKLDLAHYKILAFRGGDHGNGHYGRMLSVQDGKQSNGQHIIEDFPTILFPYEENITANRQSESEVLEKVRKHFLKNKDSLAGLIVEPLQSRQIRYASSGFYNGLLDICDEFGVAFICDETKTSGYSNGRIFSHYNWVSEKKPSIVTFGGRTRLNGFFTTAEYKEFVNETDLFGHSAEINDVLLFDKLGEIGVKKDWLDLHNSSFKSSFRTEMDKLQSKLEFKVSNIRGEGKIFGFDVHSKKLRDEIVWKGRDRGFKVNPKGDRTIGFTPSLLFAEFHLSHYLNWLRSERFYQVRMD